MNKITPFLWFEKQAAEAAQFYVSAFKNSKVVTNSPASVTFALNGQGFIALNGGPYYQFTPAVSFYVSCETPQEVDQIWGKLSEGGTALMPIGEYPFSKRFGWVADKYGVSWQIGLTGQPLHISPFFMFVGEQLGKAEEAAKFYVSLFKNSEITKIERYQEGESPTDKAGTVKHEIFKLHGQEFMAIDSGHEHQFTISGAISFFVNCKTQDEVDVLWEKFTEGGEVLQCGWVKDRFGVFWQIIPEALGRLMGDPDRTKAERVMMAMMKMKKIDIAALERAYAGSN